MADKDRAMADGEPHGGEESERAEDDLAPKDDSDSSYVFVPPTTDHDPPNGHPDHDSNDNDAPPPQEQLPSQDPHPDVNGVHHDTQLHSTMDSPVADATVEPLLSNVVEDSGLAADTAPQSPAGIPASRPVHIVDDEDQVDVEPHSSLQAQGVQDSQISVLAEDPQPDFTLAEGERPPQLNDEVSAEVPQTESRAEESAHDQDMPPPSVEIDVKLVAADNIDSSAPQEEEASAAATSALDGDLHPGLGDRIMDSNGNTSEQSLSQKNESLTFSNSMTEDSCPITCRNDIAEHLTDETSSAGGHAVEVSNGHIDCVQELVPFTNVAHEALLSNDLVDLHQPTPRESQLSAVVKTCPSAVSHEDAFVLSRENGMAAPVGDLEPVSDAPDGNPLLPEAKEDIGSGIDAGESNANESHLPEDTKVQRERDTVHATRDAVGCCPTNGITTEIEIGTIPLMFTREDVSGVSEFQKDVAECANMSNEDNPDAHASADDSTDDHSVETNPSEEVKAGSLVQTSLTAPPEDVHSKDAHVSESEVLYKSMCSTERASDDPDIESGGHQNSNVECLNKTLEKDGTNGVHMDETSTSCIEGSTSDSHDGQNTLTDVVRRPCYYIIKLPRYYEDQSFNNQVADAELQVAEKTKSRDAIQVQRQVTRGKCKEYAEIKAAAKAARVSLSAKRREMDSINLVINRVKVASQVDDIDVQIRNMERRMQHETLPLKEEKQLIREIKQLKQDREQLSYKMASQVEVKQAIDQKDQAEESLKLLKKEADLLRENLVKAEAAAKVAEQKLDNEQKKLEQLDAQYRSANDIRQDAYAHLQSLKKQLHDKKRVFSQYRGDSERAKALAINKDWQGLENHCDNQVDRVMELWNNDCEFRKDYMRCNLRSTIWRLGTLDGRSLGPNEEPPVIPTVNEKVAKLKTPLKTLSSESTAEVEKSVPRVDIETNGEKSLAKVGDKKNLTAKPKDPARPAATEECSTTVSGGDKIEQAREEDHKLTKEEEEMAKMAEELRKEEEAARLKEQRKMEEKAKAKQAMERKQRTAERAQSRAAVKAQKEAELKEKEREKRARKKEKKKATTEEANPAIGDSSSTAEVVGGSKGSEEAREKPVAVTKKPQKAQQFTKQSKPKSIPPRLRNRGKRKMQTWMWALVAVLVVVALFVLGNSSFFSLNPWLDRFRL